MAKSLLGVFTRVPDPRMDRGQRHRLSDIMVMAVLSMLCGAGSLADMEEFGHAKESWLKMFLRLPHGIPSHDTIGRVLAAIDPEQFEACFMAWTRAVAGEITGVVAIDGKTPRRSFDRAAGKAAIHMISAWSSDHGVVFGQLAVDDKSHEITAIPNLLEMLNIKGLIVTIDAMGCQKQIARQIVERGGDYVLPVKGNQPRLLEDIQEMFRWARARDFKGIRHAIQNLSRVRRLTLNLLNLEKSGTRSLRAKKLKACWDHDYLLTLLKP